MSYSHWLHKVFPELSETSNEIISSYIDEAKSDTEVLREFLKVLGGLFFVLPFNLYLYISGLQSFDSPIYRALL